MKQGKHASDTATKYMNQLIALYRILMGSRLDSEAYAVMVKHEQEILKLIKERKT